MRRCAAGLGLALAVLALAGAASAGSEPRREDYGDLVVLHVRGSYREMGRQQAELLGPLAREAFAWNRADYADGIAQGGAGAWLLDRVGVPLASVLGRRDASGMGGQIAGLAEGLGVAPRELLRASFALDAASTVFLATRSATADGGALIGRNADWGDAGGRRRPVVTHYHPTGGDLAHVTAGWPLLTLPVVGLNEAGFALSMNFFETEPLLEPLRGEWPHRRALQTARSVEEGIRIFTETRRLAFACFMAMADASGAIALVECRPGGGCAVFRPEGDWFAHANHARSARMLAHDRYRSPDSFARQAGMEAAVRRRLGALTPALATEVLRDRSGQRHPNATSVANLFVLNAAVVQPAAGVLWHSTAMQPSAPFGEYRGFSPVRDPAGVPPLPAAPELGSHAFARELEAVARGREALRAQRDAGRAGDAAQRRAGYERAGALWDELAAAEPPILDPARVALARAHALAQLGDLEGAFAALAPAEAPQAPYEARAYGLAGRALLADALGRRDDALRLWRATLAHLDSAPEFNVFEALRSLAEAALERPPPPRELPIAWWDVGLPR
jgi:hypothetical protein